MGAVAFLFPGQGAQAPGMGQDLYRGSAAARSLLDRLEQIRPGTLRQCFAGDPDELAETAVTQPCLYAVELAAAAAAREAGISCACAAGFSLGELTALAVSGAVSPEDGFRLVIRRGALMQEAAQRHPGVMAAVLRLPQETVEQLCARHGFYPVNYNCPGQISVSGSPEALAAFSADVKAAGGRAIPLKVRGGFHSPMMQEAAAQFSAALAAAAFREPAFPLYSDCTAEPYPADIRPLLAEQICSPVHFQAIIERMTSRGVDTFLELGPGRTLSGMVSRIRPDARTLQLEDCAGLETVKKEIFRC